nr:MAG TPA: hypothetical protein [Microviridae sp.]
MVFYNWCHLAQYLSSRVLGFYGLKRMLKTLDRARARAKRTYTRTVKYGVRSTL